MQPQGQAALVTGASRGIGKEIALELARRGCRVAVNYYNDPQPMVDATVAEIRALGREVLPIQADIRSSSQVAAMFEQVIAAFGRLDLLVNNAGVQTWKPLLEVTEEEDCKPYKKSKRDDIRQAAQALFTWSRVNAPLGSTCVPSLQAALPEWRRIC